MGAKWTCFLFLRKVYRRTDKPAACPGTVQAGARAQPPGWQKLPSLGNGGSGKQTEQARGRKGQQGFRFPSQSEFSGEAEPEGYEAHTHLDIWIGLRG